jgi:ribosomal protein S18 acetylase RimI-like enzyme
MDSATRIRIDKHTIAARALQYRTISGGLFEVMPNWTRGYSGLQLPVFNIFFPRTPAGLTDDTLADTAAFFSSRSVFYAVELIHDVLPDGPDLLNQRRYQSLPPQPAMFADGIPDQIRRNSQVVIERVATVPALTAFCTTQHAVFDFPLRDMLALYPVSQIKEDRIEHYLAFLDEQPVGAGSLIVRDDVASIWNVSTIDSYRRRGVATTLLHQMLTDAGERNCDLFMLYSTPHAYHLFNNFGFEIYTQRQWFLPPGIDYEE